MANTKIEHMEEEGVVYYLATSEHIQGLVIQADTLSECVELVGDSVKDLMDIHKKLGNPLPIRKTEKIGVTDFKIPLAVSA